MRSTDRTEKALPKANLNLTLPPGFSGADVFQRPDRIKYRFCYNSAASPNHPSDSPWKPGLALAVVMLLSLTATWAQNQEDVPDCKPGTLVPDYSDKECTVGNLDFKFGPVTGPFGKVTDVKPVAMGLDFRVKLKFKKDADGEEPLMITYDIKIPFQVKGLKTALSDARLEGNEVALPEGALVSGKLVLGDPEKPKEQVTMVLGAFAVVNARFSKPVPAGKFFPATIDFNVHSGKPPDDEASGDAEEPVLTFADRFISSPKDDGPDSDPSP